MPWKTRPFIPGRFGEDPYSHPQYVWPEWLSDLGDVDLWGALHERFNTVPMFLQDPLSFHSGAVELGLLAKDRDHFYYLMEERRNKRLAELSQASIQTAGRVAGSFSQMSKEQKFRLIRANCCASFDCLVEFLASLATRSKHGEEPFPECKVGGELVTVPALHKPAADSEGHSRFASQEAADSSDSVVSAVSAASNGQAMAPSSPASDESHPTPSPQTSDGPHTSPSSLASDEQPQTTSPSTPGDLYPRSRICVQEELAKGPVDTTRKRPAPEIEGSAVAGKRRHKWATPPGEPQGNGLGPAYAEDAATGKSTTPAGDEGPSDGEAAL